MENTRQLTIGELVEWLSEFSDDTPIYLHAEDIPEPGDGVALDLLLFTVDAEPTNVYSRREQRSA